MLQNFANLTVVELEWIMRDLQTLLRFEMHNEVCSTWSNIEVKTAQSACWPIGLLRESSYGAPVLYLLTINNDNWKALVHDAYSAGSILVYYVKERTVYKISLA